MKAFALPLIVIMCPALTVLAVADRPRVPASAETAAVLALLDQRPAVATPGPAPLDGRPAQATGGIAELNARGASVQMPVSALPLAQSTVPAPVAALPSHSAAARTSASPLRVNIATAQVVARPLPAANALARVGTASVQAVESVDEGRFVRMVLSLDDDATNHDLLTGMGLTLRDQGPPRALGEFAAAVDCQGSDGMKMATPAGLRVVRYAPGASAPVQYVTSHPDDTYIVVAHIDSLTGAALTSLAGRNIAAVVVGHNYASDVEPGEYARPAEDVMRALKAIRLVSDAPILLAVSATNRLTRRTEKAWIDAFGDGIADFDGWAIYNMQNWAAILETPENPRKAILHRLGLPEKPCILLDFMGTAAAYRTDQADYMRSVWKAKAPKLLAALKAQGWRGAIVSTSRLADARIKAAALQGD